MAGAFGYEKEHYAVSLDIAELVLFPAIREAGTDTLIVAPGTSCRRQIADGLGVRAYHPVEVMLMAMGLP
jgi:Fe-S oxidoreductase